MHKPFPSIGPVNLMLPVFNFLFFRESLGLFLESLGFCLGSCGFLGQFWLFSSRLGTNLELGILGYNPSTAGQQSVTVMVFACI